MMKKAAAGVNFQKQEDAKQKMRLFAVAKATAIRNIFICLLLIFLSCGSSYGKEEKIPQPKEPGIYIKLEKSLVRLMPNMVFNEQGMLYIESNKPQQFLLKDVQYFVVYGKYDMSVFTLNPLLFFQPSSLGKLRFMIGKNIEVGIQDKGKDLYVIKPKALMGRGYYCIWIEDSVWDFFIE